MNCKIAIIDDDANARIIAATLLELRDFAVQTHSGAEVASAALDDCDLVLVDLETAGIDGLRALQRLRRRSATAVAPFLVVALGGEAPEAARFAERTRPDAILRKPLDPRDLIATVETLLNQRLDQPAADAS